VGHSCRALVLGCDCLGCGEIGESLPGFRSPETRGILLACIGSLCSILIHSFTDFNLQIPSNVCCFSRSSESPLPFPNRRQTSQTCYRNTLTLAFAKLVILVKDEEFFEMDMKHVYILRAKKPQPSPVTA
jgi:hypothetical protein